MKRIRASIICALIGLIIFSLYVTCPALDYDSGGKRDPFVPLIDESGFRTDLFQSGDSAELPVKFHILGILWSEDAPMAIINGEVAKEGDYIEGVKIEKIETESVSISYQNKVYKLIFRKEDEGR